MGMFVFCTCMKGCYLVQIHSIVTMLSTILSYLLLELSLAKRGTYCQPPRPLRSKINGLCLPLDHAEVCSFPPRRPSIGQITYMVSCRSLRPPSPPICSRFNGICLPFDRAELCSFSQRYLSIGLIVQMVSFRSLGLAVTMCEDG